MPSSHRTILIQPEAPAKPAEGATCNGCGLCCLAEPCPLGVALSKRRRGACAALRWDAKKVVYRCGAVTDSAEVVRAAVPESLAWLARPLGVLLGYLAARWISAGSGCDSSLEPTHLPPSTTMDN